jgi:hypothetical protein
MIALSLRTLFLGVTVLLAPPGVAQPVPFPLQKEKPKFPPPPPLPAPGPLTARTGDDAVRVLKIERHNALLELVARHRTTIQLVGGTREDLEAYLEALSKFTAARLELETNPAERVAVLKILVEQFQQHDEAMRRRFESGNLRPHDVVRARIARLDAELRLAEEQAAVAPSGKTPAQLVPLAPTCVPLATAPRHPRWRR